MGRRVSVASSPLVLLCVCLCVYSEESVRHCSMIYCLWQPHIYEHDAELHGLNLLLNIPEYEERHEVRDFSQTRHCASELWRNQRTWMNKTNSI